MAFSQTLSVLTGTQTGPLFIEPLRKASVALQVTRVIQINDAQLRLPKITADPSVTWLGPNDEIEASEAAGDEIIITPQKVGGIVYLANETVADSNPDAARTVGEALVGDFQKKIDEAFFGPHITDEEDPNFQTYRPAGLESIPLANLQRIDANPATGIDPWTDAYFAAEEAGSTIQAWVTTPAVARALAKVKAGTGSNSTLLDFVDGRRTIHGSPVFTSPYVTAGTVWGIPSSAYTVMRKDVEIAFDRSVRFSRDQTAVRGLMRLAFAFPLTRGIVKIVD